MGLKHKKSKKWKKIITKKIFSIIFPKNKTWKYKYNEDRDFDMEKNEREKNKEISIYHEKDMIKNLKKYYNIDDHFDLLKYIKKNVTNTSKSS